MSNMDSKSIFLDLNDFFRMFHRLLWQNENLNLNYLLIFYVICITNSIAKSDMKINQKGEVKQFEKNGEGLFLWIDERQVKMFSGLSMEIYIIVNGNVLPYISDPQLSQLLPVIPSEVGYVNFTWKAGKKTYLYHFDILNSSDPSILEPPSLSIEPQGRVKRKPREFSISLPCSGNRSGIATFEIGLVIKTGKGILLEGTPLRLSLKKECAHRGVYLSKPGPDPECDKKCANEGWCNHEKICQCPEGYMGQYCKTALCYPQCANGGNCSAPGICSCPPGYQGRHCEGGICSEKCLNGGKCVQKDTCECPKGYFGIHCEHSKCLIPCLNGGKCKGVNKCKCPLGLRGNHCEIGRRVLQRSTCTKVCKHGICGPNNVCKCLSGWRGRLCNRNKNFQGRHKRQSKQRLNKI